MIVSLLYKVTRKLLSVPSMLLRSEMVKDFQSPWVLCSPSTANS
ncbi:hypothetical protein B0I31_10965 [Saccharothrix carnea]|uniref:Uncharacterized protein n=1 Tax=Saccharothrix carnea TaxID=1280637 RepID=A0A2P8I485_SACCR|nr:hypothetical protein B0I31_10965 [Saccharothrix carnea]